MSNKVTVPADVLAEGKAYGEKLRKQKKRRNGKLVDRTEQEVIDAIAGKIGEILEIRARGFTPSSNLEDKRDKFDCIDALGNKHQIKSIVKMSNNMTMQDLKQGYFYTLVFCDGKHYEPLFRDIPGQVLIDLLPESNEYWWGRALDKSKIPEEYKVKDDLSNESSD